jgi:hypothetical protein
MPRPRFEPTAQQRQLVEMTAGFGLCHRDICLLVTNPRTQRPIDEKTLRKMFRSELDTGAVKANMAVAKSLWRKAINGDVTAAIWWTKCRMGWTAQSEAPAGPTVNFNFAALTDEQLEAAEAALEILDRVQKSAAGGRVPESGGDRTEPPRRGTGSA